MEGFSQAADNNKTPILNTFSEWLSNDELVLEIGSGSGQHAIHIAKALQKIRWQPTEHPSALQPLMNNIASFGSPNILAPESLDLAAVEWPTESVDCVYSANVIHIVEETHPQVLVRKQYDSSTAFYISPIQKQNFYTLPDCRPVLTAI